MTVLFEASDPRGYRVICTTQAWQGHVLVARPWMEGWEALAQATIESPTFGIFGDRDYPDRHIYYRLRSASPRYFKVVAEFDDENGTVITAFPTKTMKAGEFLIWPTSNR